MGSSSDGDRPWQSFHTVYTNAKAGMEGVDKEKVQKIVYEMSKGSKYFENEQRKEAYIKQKVESLHAHCVKFTEKEILHYQKLADRRITELEVERDFSKVWLHSDMDAFYAAVETLEDPALQGKPLAVGSMSMICTANYEARKFGVRAAMPGFIARKLCPDLVFVPTNFEKYTYYSELTRKVFSRYDSNFIATSLDEAYLNITNICTERAVNGIEVAEELRNAIHRETGLTCSAGVAPNRLLAKVCSDINKPNGQYFLPNDRRAVMAFISSLPIRKIGGIGKVTEHLLREVLGIKNCEEMLQKRALICALFPGSSSDFFLSAALGLGPTETPQLKGRKSISCERTFAATSDPTMLFQKLEELSESLSNDMRKECLHGRTLTLKLKTASFEVRTRAASLPRYFHSKEDILTHAIKLLKTELPLSLRLIGLRISHFEDDKNVLVDPAQKTLTSFIVSGDSSRSLMSEEHSEFSDVSSNGDLLDLDFESNVGNGVCFSNDTQKKSMPQTGLVGNVEKVDAIGCFSVPKVVCVSEPKEELVWLEGYICSICGVELPPSFHEERQEHSDFHMAENLQEEENKGHTVDSWNKRNVKENMQTKGQSRKRPKQSPCSSKHLPIDSFFIKGKRAE